MTRYDVALEEWISACAEEQEWKPGRGSLSSIMARRDAATRELHAAEDPWTDCLCPLCSGQD